MQALHNIMQEVLDRGIALCHCVIPMTTTRKYWTGSNIAQLLDVQQPTWSRWVKSGKAPEPDIYNGSNLHMYSTKVIAEWIIELSELT